MTKRLATYTLIALLGAIHSARAEDASAPAGWQTWTSDGGCFALVYPSSTTGGRPGTKGDRAYIAVKHVPKEKTYDGVAIASGMDVPVGAEAVLDVGGREFPLLVFRGAGFVRSAEDKILVESLGKAEEAKVTWMFKDELTVQTYRFKGFDTAKRTIDAGCPRPKGEAATTESEPAETAATPAKPAPRKVRRSRHGRG